jgi:hypothetical protein
LRTMKVVLLPLTYPSRLRRESMAINQGQAPSRCAVAASSLSDLKNRSVVGLAGKPHSGCSQNSAGRGQILTISPGNSRSIAQESGEIWTGQADLQPIYFKSDRLLAPRRVAQA